MFTLDFITYTISLTCLFAAIFYIVFVLGHTAKNWFDDRYVKVTLHKSLLFIEVFLAIGTISLIVNKIFS
jgi:hypothetical protein